MIHYFITFSRGDLIPKGSLDNYLKTFKKWLYVHEFGDSGSNLHYHAIVGMDAPGQRSDKITEKARIAVYPGDSLLKIQDESGTLRFLVQTKSCSTKAGGWQKLYTDYLSKEAHNKEMKNLTKSDTWDTKELDNIYKQAKIFTILKRDIFVTLKTAPRMILQYAEEQEENPRQFTARQWMELMMRNNYICHHLFDDKQLIKIQIGFNALTYVSEPTKLKPKTKIPKDQYIYVDDPQIII